MSSGHRRIRATLIALALSAPASGPLPAAPSDAARELRQALLRRVGELSLLRVPRADRDLPQPRRPDGSLDPRYAITEPKRLLGKMLFFDPIRTNHIRPEFGGVEAMAQTASCGSCHLGAAAGKAGLPINLAVGGEGLGFPDPSAGRFVIRRRVRPGLVDILPTPIELVVDGEVVQSGRFDAVDSVPRLSPSMVGFAFNNRLLGGGVAGEPSGPGKANANPDGLPAGENLAELAARAHRMAGTQNDALQAIPAYVRLFREAYPAEAALAEAAGELGLLINDRTVARSVAAFLRTVVTRDTPWDRFLAGDDAAMTRRQIRGGLLFARSTEEGGANCIACHSGPALNKTLGDERGVLVEENFHNVGIGDHPLVDLARATLGDPSLRDVGRAEATGDPADAFEFRAPTLRQLRDGSRFTHSAAFRSVREVVLYFNAGIPQDSGAAAAGNLSRLFTQPRGTTYPPGLGLNPAQIDALVDFLENALYDPGLRRPEPGSPTRPFDPTARELRYSTERPDLAALGAPDGRMPSGLPPFNADPLSRRDLGLELLDVSGRIEVKRTAIRAGAPATGAGRPRLSRVERITLVNRGADPIDTDLMIVLRGLTEGLSLANADGISIAVPEPALPYRRVFLEGGTLAPGASLDLLLRFSGSPRRPLDYEAVILSGQAAP
ncbi:MAG: cytochrome-c peroxidase [Acidobacteriota bacterium]